MEAINMFVDNYKEATRGLHIFLKVLFALVFAFIMLAVISALVNVLVY